MSNFEFEEFAKIPRLKTRIVITEKIDGTNAQIAIFGPLVDQDLANASQSPKLLQIIEHNSFPYALFAGSRGRYITPTDDNFGFARWVHENQNELVQGLGPGRHYGEWWGSGIQRTYGLVNGNKRFSLFNTLRWRNDNPPPDCCNVVPILFDGENPNVPEIMAELKRSGSVAAPGYMNPEGIILYYTGAKDRGIFKETFDHPQGKWASQLAAVDATI